MKRITHHQLVIIVQMVLLGCTTKATAKAAGCSVYRVRRVIPEINAVYRRLKSNHKSRKP